MEADKLTELLRCQLRRAGMLLSPCEVNILRRAQLTLHRWAERECNGEVERDDDGGKPYFRYQSYPGKTRIRYVADLESGALRRIHEVCKDNNIYYFHQGDPRGCALYVSKEPLNDQNYSSRGTACCV